MKSMGHARRALPLVVAALCTFFVGCGGVAPTHVAGRPDPFLAKQMAAQLPVGASEPAELKMLVIDSHNWYSAVGSLNGIERCPDLEVLWISNGDLQGWGRAGQARHPDGPNDYVWCGFGGESMQSHKVGDLERLRPLGHLQDLNLDLALRGAQRVPFKWEEEFRKQWPEIGESLWGRDWRRYEAQIDGLAGCRTLTRLSLKMNNIYNLAPLAGLTDLEVLDLYGNPCSDLRPLVRLTKLRELYLGQTHGYLEDIAPVAGMQALEVVDLCGTGVVDLAPLLQLPKLRVVNLYESEANYATWDKPEGPTGRQVAALRAKGIWVLTWQGDDSVLAPDGVDWTTLQRMPVAGD